MKRQRLINVILAVFGLVLGYGIYIIYRPDVIIGRMLDSFEFVLKLRQLLSDYSSELFRFYLSDYLWGFSLCCSFVAVFEPTRKGCFYCCLTGFSLGLLWEILQFFNITNGTGDIVDILMYLLAGITVFLINYKEQKKK